MLPLKIVIELQVLEVYVNYNQQPQNPETLFEENFFLQSLGQGQG